MKVKQLIEMLQDYEDFEVEFRITDGYSTFPNIRTFSVNQLEDIGYSDKVIVLGGEEQ